ncbi:SusC/RagA family TonB-linked outer membrane protein [Aridibaculum aurantiacum]|uniref:SusC/RagA family TonB-linked outer membrane protein n=1 Tax=Aridibaculum aurantiacum TaxID=2810307 RepID=UPI001A9648A1|nr:TonB-dependent receptor [Aridibaculum aurantiacum]
MQKLITRGSLVLLLLIFNFVQLFAQQRVVTGTIVNDETREPLVGVTVGIKGTTRSTTTVENGKYSIMVSGNESVIKFTYVGFLYQEVTVGSRNVIDIALVKENKQLDDVVVIGYGSQKRIQNNGAIATIKAAEIEDIPAPNIAGALRGRIAGLGVNTASGRPGAGITLNVRNSTRSETAATVGATDEPLYVIDGIIVQRQEFDNLDPSMVEDLTVLKDASAAIYGAAGAKGVILVTTKRGKAGKPRLSYNGYVGHTDATRKPDMLSAYEHAVLLNDGYRIGNAPANLFFSPADLEYIKGLNYKTWFEELWQASTTQRHNLSVSGGSDRITFFVGGAYQNENGNYAGQKQDKYTFRSGVNTTITPALKADISFNVDSRIRTSQNSLADDRDQGFLESIIQTPGWVPVSIDGMPVSFNGASTHPLGSIGSGFYSNSKSRSYRINSSLTYQPTGFLKGFTARVQFSQTAGNTNSAEYRPNYRVYNFQRMGNNNQLYSNKLDTVRPYFDAVAPANVHYTPRLGENTGYQGFLTLQYDKTLGKHIFGAIVGAEQTVSRSEDMGVRWINQQLVGIDDYWAFDQSVISITNRGISESRKRSGFARMNYNFDNKYFIDGVTRLDASSNFAAGKVWGVFPSVGLGWVVSREKFFKNNIPQVNYLKLRVNYGLTGDDRIEPLLWKERYRVDLSGYLYNESMQAGLNPVRIPNPNLTWEKKRTLNFGIDMTMFNNKLNIGVDFFQNYIYDAFDKGNDQNFPMFAGFAAPIINYQERHAWGSEFTIGYRSRVGKDLNINTSINFGFANSVTDRMFYNRFQLFENSPPDWQVQMGTDPRKYNSSNFGLKTLGMFRTQDEVDAFLAQYPNYTIDGKVPQPGWLYFEDTNGDGRITERDMVAMFDRTDPWFSSGINIGIAYKSLSLSTNLVARFGGKQFYGSKDRERPEPTQNVPGFWRDRWTPENPGGKFPRHDDASIVRQWNSDFWAFDATTIRVNNMTLSYRIPTSILNRFGFSDARILATGNNLWIIKSPLKLRDPYSNSILDYPTLRTISLGLSLGL